MAQVAHIISNGIPPNAALAINGSNYSSGGLTATGTTKATSLLLGASKNYISLCSSSKGVCLPQCAQGDKIEVFNGGLNTLTVYTNSSLTETITNNSTLAGFAIATMRSATFDKVTSSLWMVNYSA